MTDATIYRLLQILSVLLTVASVCMATASNLPDLGLGRQTIAVLIVVQAGISVVQLYLPGANKQPGNRRGDSTDN